MKSLAKIRKRLSRCYELAARAMLNEADSDQWVLVHGSGVNPGHGERLRHAWIELNDGRTYHADIDVYEPTDWFMAHYQVQVEHRYSRQEACALISATRCYGPWTDEERAANKSVPHLGKVRDKMAKTPMKTAG